MRQPIVRTFVPIGAVLGLTIAFGALGAARGQQQRPSDIPSGPAPTVTAVERESGAVAFQGSADAPAPAPNHPPIDQIPPRAMPDDTVERPAASGPGQGIVYDPATGTARVSPMSFGAAAEGLARGGGYTGADGGAGEEPATMSGNMSALSTSLRAQHPYRMNVKVVIRDGTSYSVCSGTMRDAETVLTAGHCVFDFGGTGWADEIWVYPAWDGVGPHFAPPSSIMNPYGFARGTNFGSWTGWTVDGDLNYDVGLIGLQRAVGMLTGWFGWSYGGDCGFWTSQVINNGSYPAEACGGGLHTGRDMYFFSGDFDSCPSFNRLQIDTSGGCFNAIWGGMSGSGVYYIDGSSRYVHGITSTSDRSTYGRYARQFQGWVDWTENTFIPGVRGAAFDLEPLDVNAGPVTIVAGTSTSLLNHLAANATNGAANATWTYRVYLSTNDGITSVDTLLSTQSYAWNFGAMSSVTVNMANVTIPANTPTGTYYLGVIYDTSTDGNSGNNDSSGWDAVPITVLNVDLDVTLVSAPVSAQPGDSVIVSNTVQNIGNATSAGFDVGLYFSTDSTCTTSDTFLASRAVGSLGAGGASNANTPVTIPGGAAAGTRYICAIADRLSQVAEFSETNNTGFDTISIISPDLSISVLTVPALASPGSSITVANTAFNGGTGAAGGFGVGLYLSTDNICTTGDTLLATRGVAGLAAGASSAANTPVTIPSGTPFSSRFICAIVDSANGVSESNESNNSLARAVSVVSSTPIVNLKINGIDAATVASTGAVLLTLDISPSTWTTPVDWYWVIVVGGSTSYVTASGLSTTPAPLVTASPSPFTNATLLNLTLPPGTSMTNGFFLLNGATVVGSDVTTVNVAATAATPQQ